MRRGIDGYTLAVVDLLTALVVVFAAMAVLAILAATKETAAGVKPGGIIVQMRWQKSADADVDLWVKAPGDEAVGYSHMSDAHCNLLRDDLGRTLDPESRNQEMVVCRGIDPGEWVVDAMLYRSYDDQVPIKVTVTVREGPLLTEILDRTIELQSQGQQVTLWRFRIDARDHLAPDSVNHLPMRLYGGGEAHP
ncbi:MAG: hypothetical protein ACRET0_09860 [Steroidobacteraceae bacterium]